VAPSKQREREVERQRRLRQAQRREAARRRARRRNAILGSALAVVVVIGAIAVLATSGGGKKSAAGATSTPTPSASTAAFPPVPAGSDPRLKTKPTATLPKAAPTRLGVRDLIVGHGAVAKAGQQVTVNYVGVGYPGGKEFVSSWKARQAFPFQLGTGAVIKGWDEGVAGMKVGGRRQLSIPSPLAYGTQGQPPTIKPNEPLIFVIDLLAVR
jgi:peptidylprolyl isomerase